MEITNANPNSTRWLVCPLVGMHWVETASGMVAAVQPGRYRWVGCLVCGEPIQRTRKLRAPVFDHNGRQVRRRWARQPVTLRVMSPGHGWGLLHINCTPSQYWYDYLESESSDLDDSREGSATDDETRDRRDRHDAAVEALAAAEAEVLAAVAAEAARAEASPSSRPSSSRP